MSQVAMTTLDRVRALDALWVHRARSRLFVPRPLSTAAISCGASMPNFCGRQDGGTVTQLIEKALDRNHAHASTYGHKMQVYHLSARPFYAALGQADNRNRRRRQLPTIKNKIMGLDFVLAHRDYLLSRHRTREAGLLHRDLADSGLKPARQALPGARNRARQRRAISWTNTRCFCPKRRFPAAPLWSPFASWMRGMATLSHFETFLAQYRPLFASLSEFRLIYVAATETLFNAAQKTFERFVGSAANRQKRRRS